MAENNIQEVIIHHSKFTNGCQKIGANLKMIPAAYRDKDATRFIGALADNVVLAQEQFAAGQEAIKTW